MRPRTWLVLLGLLLSTTAAQAVFAAGQILPAGTILTVRTTQPLFADYTQPGMRLAGIVDDAVTLDGRVAVPRGTQATLEVVGVDRSSTMKGRDRIRLTIRALHVRGGSYPVATNFVEFKGPSEGKKARNKILGGAAVGGLVGGLIGGGSGAALGAAAGGGTGAAVAGSGKAHLVVPAETPLQFQLMESMRIN